MAKVNNVKHMVTKNTYIINVWDRIFCTMTKGFYAKVGNCARENVMQILMPSKNFLVKENHNSLPEFHDLYFGSIVHTEKTENYNSETSDFGEQLQKRIKKDWRRGYSGEPR
ncbi:MAG: hypothetical protein AB8G05_24715 [Oligoflexales bacterium]